MSRANSCARSILAALLGLAAASARAGLFDAIRPMGTVIYEVFDEEGNPVEGAHVGATFDDVNEVSGTTDAEGRAILSARTHGYVTGGVGKDGYYSTGADANLASHVPDGVRIGRRFPAVTVRVELRPVISQVPVFAYEFAGRLPLNGEDVGFDFLKADWVAPHGSGEEADVFIRVLTFNPSVIRGDWEFSWRFPRPGDGMARVAPEDYRENSEFPMPRYAPVAGYTNRWTSSCHTTVEGRDSVAVDPPGPRMNETQFVFRIRTELDSDGNVVKAIYGRINSADKGIGIQSASPGSKATVCFIFYVNPDGTRNLEFDLKRNLFEGFPEPVDRRWFPSLQ